MSNSLHRPYILLLTLLFFLALVGGACRVDSTLVRVGLITASPTPDPFRHYRAALQPANRHDIEGVGPVPRYHITVRLSEDRTTLIGVMQVVVPAPGPELLFRLYPNMENYGRSMQVTQARIDGAPVEVTPAAGGTAIRLALPAGETPPASTTVDMAFRVQLGPYPEAAANSDYTLFGWDGAVLSLPGFYPTLAVKQGESWMLDQPARHGDVLFNQVALYQLDIALPREMMVAAGGVTLNVIDNPDGSRTWQIAGGPLRDMTVIAGPFLAVSERAAGALVTSYYLPGHEAAAQAVLAHATASLRLYSDLYGPYPYTELDLVEAPLNVRGMEYSGLALIGEDLYGDRRDFLTFLVAHEVAHQWWYAVVGNDPYRYPWLDEGLTEYSAFDYYKGVFGRSEAERLLVGRWELPFDVAAGGNIDGAVDRPAAAFDPISYELLVYAKAALFFNALRQELGDEMYQRVMQTYYLENRYGIATPQTLSGVVQRVSGRSMDELTEEWLR